MSLAVVHSRARSGVHAPAVSVEVHLAGGLPNVNIVGLPEAAVRESKDRVRAAIQCAQLEFPARRITVNLAPADLKKHGGRFDLPIALGILAASGQLPLDALTGRGNRLTDLVQRLRLVGGALEDVTRMLSVGLDRRLEHADRPFRQFHPFDGRSHRNGDLL